MEVQPSGPILVASERPEDRGKIIVDAMRQYIDSGAIHPTYANVLRLPHVADGNTDAMHDLYGGEVGGLIGSVRLIMSGWSEKLGAGLESIQVVNFRDRFGTEEVNIPGTAEPRAVGVIPRFLGVRRMRLGLPVDRGIKEVVTPTTSQLPAMCLSDLHAMKGPDGESVLWRPHNKKDGPLLVPSGKLAAVDLAVFDEIRLRGMMATRQCPVEDAPREEDLLAENAAYVCDYLVAE